METAREHPIERPWVDCLVTPTVLSLMFLRGELNGDFILQHHCLKAMLPYLFVEGHHNYASYLSWYVRQMEHLPQCQGGPIRRCARVSALGWGYCSASRSVWRADIYQAREIFWRYDGHFNKPRASFCVCIVSVCAPTLTFPWNIQRSWG